MFNFRDLLLPLCQLTHGEYSTLALECWALPDPLRGSLPGLNAEIYNIAMFEFCNTYAIFTLIGWFTRKFVPQKYIEPSVIRFWAMWYDFYFLSNFKDFLFSRIFNFACEYLTDATESQMWVTTSLYYLLWTFHPNWPSHSEDMARTKNVTYFLPPSPPNWKSHCIPPNFFV